MEKKKNSNLAAILIGFLLIGIVTAIIFWKNSSPKEENKKEENFPKEEASKTDAQKITAEELSTKIKNKEEIFIIDIRNIESFQKEHIIDSINIPLETFDSSSLLKDGFYVFIDSGSDPEAMDLANYLVSQKILNKAYYLLGGFVSWQNSLNQTISEGDPYSMTDHSKVTFLSSDKLKETIATEEGILIIDVRNEKQFKEGHIQNAMNIFLDDLEKRRKEIPFSKKIVVYDNDGLWAFKAAVRLFDLSFINVVALSDGLDAWKSKGFEIVTSQ